MPPLSMFLGSIKAPVPPSRPAISSGSCALARSNSPRCTAQLANSLCRLDADPIPDLGSLRWTALLQSRAAGIRTWPAPGAPLAAAGGARRWPRGWWIRRSLRRPRRSAPAVAVTFINHASFLIRLPGAVVLTDPIFSRRCSPVSLGGAEAGAAARHRAGGPAAAGHGAAVAQPLRPHGPAQPAGAAAPPRAALRHHARQRRALARHRHRRDRTGLVGGGSRSGTAAHHRDAGPPFLRPHAVRPQPHPMGRLHARGPAAGRCCSPAIPAPGRIGGDIRTRLGAPDVALLPIGAYEPRWFMAAVHMNPAEAVEAHLALARAASVGMHFGTFQLTDEAIDAPLHRAGRGRRAIGLAQDRFTTHGFGETRLYRFGGTVHAVAPSHRSQYCGQPE